jgi:hypothetical protein
MNRLYEVTLASSALCKTEVCCRPAIEWCGLAWMSELGRQSDAALEEFCPVVGLGPPQRGNLSTQAIFICPD